MGQEPIGPKTISKKKKKLRCGLTCEPTGLWGEDADQPFWSPFIMRASPVQHVKKWPAIDWVKLVGLARLPTTTLRYQLVKMLVVVLVLCIYLIFVLFLFEYICFELLFWLPPVSWLSIDTYWKKKMW